MKYALFALLIVAGLLAIAPGSSTHAAFPGTNGRIAFSMQDSGGKRHIWAMNPDGGDRRQITNNPDDDLSPSWSADGTRFVFRRNSANGGQLKIWGYGLGD